MNKRIFLLILLAASFILLQTALGQTKQKWVAPESANSLKNPYTGNSTVANDVQYLYVRFCAPCHGEKGKGDGFASANLGQRPADHTTSEVQSQSDGVIFWKLSEGRNPMPAYKLMLTDEKRWALVNYIRTLSKK